MLLRVALHAARDDYGTRRERQRKGIAIARAAGRYTGRKADTAQHRRIVGLLEAGISITRTAEFAGCSIAQVKRLTAPHRARSAIITGERTGAREGNHPRDRGRT